MRLSIRCCAGPGLRAAGPSIAASTWRRPRRGPTAARSLPDRDFVDPWRIGWRQRAAIEVEPGRSIVGHRGRFAHTRALPEAQWRKEFIIVDAAMNDLSGPRSIAPTTRFSGAKKLDARRDRRTSSGPVCETGDFLARGREMPGRDARRYLAVITAGAYGFVLASNYNSRPARA